MFSLPAIFALGNAWVHVCISNNSNIAFYIKVSVNQFFSIATTLNITIFNLEDTLMTQGFDAIETSMSTQNSILY